MILEVIVDISVSEVDRTFDYIGDDIPLGSRVAVEFGRKKMVGFVVGKKDKSEFQNLKSATYLDCPIDAKQLKLLYWMREMYNLRFIDVLRLFIPSKLRDEVVSESARKFIFLKSGLDIDACKVALNRAKKQLEIFEYLQNTDGEFLSVLAEKFSLSAIGGLRERGFVSEESRHIRAIPLNTLNRQDKAVTLTIAQQIAVETIMGDRNSFLLHGVTGSGKTEIYLNIIEKMQSEQKGAIMLVPEISLTPQMLGIFRARFGDRVAILHSGLNQSERYDEWQRLKSGDASIALGARSAVFAPISNLGVIIVDEEHDSSYKSESNPRYCAKEVASKRAEIAGAKLVLGSATPDIETYQKAISDKLCLINLPDRISNHKLPEMQIVDMTSEFRQGNDSMFSSVLQDAIRDELKLGHQIMIFLNRRGYASFVRCKECGYVAKCEDCDISLTYHKGENVLKCHYCGRKYHALTKCPDCKSEKILQGRVGTEKVASELQTLFPDAKILRMDNDTTSKKDSYFNILDSFAKGKAQILVGTQMIAKGHDFENVTLVGILEADSALYFSDYRSSERTFQLMTQVAGRAGRAEKAGRVVLQTYAPKHYVFAYAKNYDYVGFFGKEVNTRQVTDFPPFTKIVRVLVSSQDEQSTLDTVKKVYRSIIDLQNSYGKFVYLGASKAPVYRIQNQSRYQVLARIKNDQFDSVIKDIYGIVDQNKFKNGSCFVEINPQSLM